MIVNDAVYGKQEIKDSLALSIINTKEMQRLKGINQYGVWKYLMPHMTATRFDHSLGVYFLLIRLGAGREEQIAGLIHDIGHTALSHVYDYAIGRAEKQDYNDEMQEKIVRGSEIMGLLEKEGISVKSIIDHKRFPLLEKELPDLCADRFDYLLRDTLYYGTTKKHEIPGFISSLNLDGNIIFINDKSIAAELATRFMEMNDKVWSGQMQNAIYSLAGQAMKIAIDRDIIKEEDFFDTDDVVMEKLKKSGVKEITDRISLLNFSLKIKEDPDDYDFFVRGKCRYIDPFVKVDGKLKKLSDADPEMKKKIESFRKEHAKGHRIKILGNALGNGNAPGDNNA